MRGWRGNRRGSGAAQGGTMSGTHVRRQYSSTPVFKICGLLLSAIACTFTANCVIWQKVPAVRSRAAFSGRRQLLDNIIAHEPAADYLLLPSCNWFTFKFVVGRRRHGETRQINSINTALYEQRHCASASSLSRWLSTRLAHA